MFLENLFTNHVSALAKSIGKIVLKRGYTYFLFVKENCPHSLIEVVDVLLSPKQRSGIDALFYKQANDVPYTRKLDNPRKNLMVFDDLMLGKQNKWKDFFVRGRHNNFLFIYLKVTLNYFQHVPRHTIRENIDLICLFPQDAKIFNTFIAIIVKI